MNARTFTSREDELAGLVTAAFPTHAVDARIVDVHKFEGDLKPTLRFTVDDAYSTDLERERIASGAESLEELLAAVRTDLAAQLPAPASS